MGEENVGLITGEERVNERAPILCCTVEMAPQSGELLVIDEVQWADDEERGSAWTRLLLAGDYRRSSSSARSTRSRSSSGHSRRPSQGLRAEAAGVGGRADPPLARDGTVVVAFSRKAVLALAGEVNRLHPGRVAVLYGAMPLASRREEIDRFSRAR